MSVYDSQYDYLWVDGFVLNKFSCKMVEMVSGHYTLTNGASHQRVILRVCCRVVVAITQMRTWRLEWMLRTAFALRRFDIQH